MLKRVCQSLFLMAHLLHAQEGGHATAKLIVSSNNFQKGGIIHAAIEWQIEKNWHGYWINPGDTGMPPSIKWNLPEGWSASAFSFPTPRRITAADMTSYALEDTVILPFTIQVSKNANADAELAGTFSWLACDEKSCTAGKSSLSKKLSLGESSASDDAKKISDAEKSIPVVSKEYSLQVSENKQQILLSITAPKNVNLEGAEIFPITEQALSAAEKIVLHQTQQTYSVSVKKSEYLEEPLKGLKIIITHPTLHSAILLEWKHS